MALSLDACTVLFLFTTLATLDGIFAFFMLIFGLQNWPIIGAILLAIDAALLVLLGVHERHYRDSDSSCCSFTVKASQDGLYINANA